MLLVVIGILIALQINNWNEDRKTNKEEIKILNELKNDLITNLSEIIETYNTTSDRQLSTFLILDYFKELRPVDDSLKKAFENIKMDGLFNIANTLYKFIESQGVNSLSNDSLRIRVTEMYERHLKNILTRENRTWEMVDDELIPLMNDRFLSSPTIDKSVSFAVEVINIPKNIKSLREDSKFKNVIVRLQNWLLMRLKWQEEAHTSIEQLIIDVQEEINKLST
ncbi:MAG: DUF6090 family protein [Eudoraea sp.]|uniref:DUF6090 family protein n=1 Tax=Eudoraea sp. TaxID=1979955 RepID=UPI003C74CD31